MMKRLKERGVVLVQVAVFAGIAAAMIIGFAQWAALSIVAARQAYERERAFQLAEAGAEYYRWHLSVAPFDYEDGTGVPGPYLHEVRDSADNVVGEFSLNIEPPFLGSGLVAIHSTGRSAGNPDLPRTVLTRLARPSFASFAVAANDVMRFGGGTEVFGPIHANGGIRFDGLAHNIVSSLLLSYNDPDHSGGNEFGVHTHLSPTDPLPPSVVPPRPDVFEAGRIFPAPEIDFDGIEDDVAEMKTAAQDDGFYRGSSGGVAYRVLFNTDDTFSLYRVTSFSSAPSGCTNSANQSGWGTWSVGNQQLIGTYPMPTNGILFLEDHAFVEGRIDGAQVTVVVERLPNTESNWKHIILNNDLLYTHYDGTDAIGLVAQGHVHVGLVSEDDLRIDAAMIARQGRVGRFYYRPPSSGSQRCSPYHERGTLTSYGMIATNLRYGFAYTDGNGYENRNLIYDANLLYAPPPSFPQTAEEYVNLIWQEE